MSTRDGPLQHMRRSPSWLQDKYRSAQRCASDWRWSSWRDYSTEKSDSWRGQQTWNHDVDFTEQSGSWSRWKWGIGWNECCHGAWNEGSNESAGSQSVTAKHRLDDDSWIACQAWTNNECVERMDLYCQMLPHDTYCGQGAGQGPWNWRQAMPDPYDKHVDAKQNSVKKFWFRMPASCNVRRRIKITESDPRSGDEGEPCERARPASIAKAALRALYEVGEVDDDLKPKRLQLFEPHTKLARPSFAGRQQRISFEDVKEWSQDELVVAHVIRGTNFAFISKLPSRFHFRLPEHDVPGATEPVILQIAEAVYWQGPEGEDVGELVEAVTDFNKLLHRLQPPADGHGAADEPIHTACVLITGPGVCIDLYGMQDAVRERHILSDWQDAQCLAELHIRLGRLRKLEYLMHAFAPALPALNPLVMESIIHQPNGNLRYREEFALIGRGVVREMAALQSFLRHPFENANRLLDRIKQMVDDNRCAGFMLGGGSGNGQALLRECSVMVETTAEAANIFFALAGAYFEDGGAPAVANVWRWCCDERDPDREIDLSLHHMHAPPFYAGRTESYTELWELTGSQLATMAKSGAGIFEPHPECKDAKVLTPDVLYLLVKYVDSDNTLYRRGDRCAEELRFENGDEKWRSVVTDPNSGVCYSPTRPGSDGAARGHMQKSALPNKINAWTSGRTLPSQANFKRMTTPKHRRCLRCLRLREVQGRGWEEDESKQEEELTFLEVVYECEDKRTDERTTETFAYARRQQGFGVEWVVVPRAERRHEIALGYSEVDKTLMSPHFSTKDDSIALPNIVIEWVCGVQSLVQLLPLPTNVSLAQGQESQQEIDVKERGVCRWSQDKYHTFSIGLELKRGRYILVRHDTWKCEADHSELWYSTKDGKWLFDGPGEPLNVHVPDNAIAHVMKIIDDADWVDILRVEALRAPWLRVPPLCMRQFVRLVPGGGFSEAEGALGHQFSNPSLLVEALTHCSANPSASPSQERLAILGEEMVSAHIRSLVANRSLLPCSACSPDMERIPTSRALAASRDLHTWRDDILRDTKEDLRELRDFHCRECQRTRSLDDPDWQDIHHHNRNICPHCGAHMHEGKDSQRTILSSCNHSAYARSCVRLKLHDLILYSSEELCASIKLFALASKQEKPKDKRGESECAVPPMAPLALGDTFLACIAALVLDGQRPNAEEKVKEHLQWCETFAYAQEIQVRPGSEMEKAVCPSGMQACLDTLNHDAAPAINMAVLNTKVHAEDALRFEQVQLERVRRNRDVHIVHTDLKTFGNSGAFGGVSPRAAIVNQGKRAVAPVPQITDDSGNVPAQRKEITEGSVYCADCQMWLNGPTQFKDHKLGIKHRKKQGRLDKRAKALGQEEPKVTDIPPGKPSVFPDAICGNCERAWQ